MYKNKRGFISYLIVIILAMTLAGVVVFNLYITSLTPIKQLQSFTPGFVTEILSNDGTVIKTFGSFKSDKITYKEIPDILKKAIIATEDKNFYQHRGFDFIALIRSTGSNLLAGHVVQGASTITQQLARILFLSSERTYDRKIKEFVLANRIEKSITKEEILTMYLNNVYLGEGAYGVSAAADVYFNKKLNELTLAEAALIAGLPQAPSVYSPYQNMELALKRRNQVLKRMYTMGYITQNEYENACDKKIRIRKSYVVYSNNKAPYFADYVMHELQQLGFSEEEVSQGGYKIYTTLNYDMQKAAHEKVSQDMMRWGMTRPYQQAALFSYDTVTGKILAYVGGKDYSQSQFDRVTQAVRQPGSAFKVFVYTTACEQGLMPDMIYSDTPVSFAEWTPHNYGHKYRGKIPVYVALAVSSNVVASRLIMDAGVEETIKMARRLGITTPIANDPTIALGSTGVKLFEITNAYGVLANGGILLKPYAIEKIENSKGEVIYEASRTTYTRVLSIDTVAKMVTMMKQVILQGTGKAANIGRPAAGKTGTTDSYRDAWFIGFTPDIVTGVWVGNDNNKPNKNVTGGTLPAKIWADYMRVATKNTPVTDFPYPAVDLKPQKLKPSDVTEAPENAPANSVNTKDLEMPPTIPTEEENLQDTELPSPVPVSPPPDPKPIINPPIPPVPSN
jgi:penicillin-binding protein 1A